MKLTDYNGHFLTLCLMATGTFAIGTDAFIVAGILDEISGTFAVSPAQAGQLISIFALAYMLFAPLTAWLLGNLNRKHILQLALVLFIAGNLVCAYADSFLQMSAGRVLAALGAACYTPQAAAAAVGLVAEKRRGLAISIVYGGMTLAIALGIPFGTFLARLIGWREIFLLIALLGAVSLLGLSLALSAIAAPGKHTLKETACPAAAKSGADHLVDHLFCRLLRAYCLQLCERTAEKYPVWPGGYFADRATGVRYRCRDRKLRFRPAHRYLRQQVCFAVFGVDSNRFAVPADFLRQLPLVGTGNLSGLGHYRLDVSGADPAPLIVTVKALWRADRFTQQLGTLCRYRRGWHARWPDAVQPAGLLSPAVFAAVGGHRPAADAVLLPGRKSQ